MSVKVTSLRVVTGLLVVIVSFVITTLGMHIFLPEGALDPVSSRVESLSSDMENTTELTSITTPSGLRLTYPLALKSGHGPERAFDGSTAPSDFWEAPFGPFPIDLTIELPAPKVLSGYTLDAGEMADRMPSAWALDGLQDGKKVILDQENGIAEWRPGESRSFQIDAAQPLQQLRFRFFAGLDPHILRIYEIELH
jgi:hypothetical protein